MTLLRNTNFLDDDFLLALRQAVLDSGAHITSCILSTKLMVEVAKQFGFQAEPVVVEVIVMNPAMAKFVRGREPFNSPLSDEEYARAAALGAHVVIIGTGESKTPNSWPGHLVALVQDDEEAFVVDLSIDQASRPHKNMPVRTPIVIPVTGHDEFLRGEVEAQTTRSDGVSFWYSVRPDDRSFEDSPDWSDDSRVQVNYIKGSRG